MTFFKVYFFFNFWWPFCSAERNSVTFGGGILPDDIMQHLSEIILKLGPWFRDCFYLF